MALRDIPGQQRAVRFLKQLIGKDAVPHAFLFSGMAGTGKLRAALEFAGALDCLERRDADMCGECGGCRKIAQNVHPDLLRVRSEGAYIKIEQIRELRERVRFRPFEGRYRIVIIEDAQKLREEAANAVLKILEEPPSGNIFILIAPESQMLLPTIVSRCCHVRFQPLADELVAECLMKESCLSPETAAEMARLAAGSLDRARWLTEEGRVAGWKKVVENLRRLEELSIMDFFPMVSEWTGNREAVEQDLECIRLWVRDLVLHRLSGDHPLTFALDGKTLEAASNVPPERLFLLYHEVEGAMQSLKVNANLQMTLEGVCLAIKDSLYGKGDWYSFSKRGQGLPF
ncbi:MAG: DNA polymerase III subunit delta' [Desulfobacteraceae bacterium]|nr:DNA polymerase III subunit delta' [Desulfobacteraceae bacterium]